MTQTTTTIQRHHASSCGKGQALAACAVLGLSGSSYGFIVSQVCIVPDGGILPSAGSFVTQYDNYFLDADLTMRRDYSFWDPADLRPFVDDTTYLALDPQKPDNFQGFSDGGPLPGGSISHPAPLGTSNLGTSIGLGPLDGSGLAAGIDGGAAGRCWNSGPENGFEVESAPTLINGVMEDSMFIGQFVVDTPGATILGSDLLVTVEDPALGPLNVFVPLDGSYIIARSAGTPYRLIFEREPAGPHAPAGSERIFAYLNPVPSPGAMGLAGVAGLLLARRRR